MDDSSNSTNHEIQTDFKTTLPHVATTSTLYGDHDRAENVEMDTTVVVDPNHGYGGWYETYDLESGGERFYAEGVLEVYFDDDGPRLTATMDASNYLNTSPMPLNPRA